MGYYLVGSAARVDAEKRVDRTILPRPVRWRLDRVITPRHRKPAQAEALRNAQSLNTLDGDGSGHSRRLPPHAKLACPDIPAATCSAMNVHRHHPPGTAPQNTNARPGCGLLRYADRQRGRCAVEKRDDPRRFIR